MEDTPQTPVAETPAATAEQTVAAAAQQAVTAVGDAAEVAKATAETAVKTVASVADKAASKAGTTVPAKTEKTTDKPGLSTNEWIGVGVAAVMVVVLLALFARRGKQGGARKSADGKAAPAKSNGDVVEIYVGNLSYDMTEAQFRKEFEKFGVVKSARIIGHRTSGKSKGYGFVEMPHRKEALVAIKALNNRDIMGRKLRVNEARNGTREE
jgi:hypothetical protein